jgi:hypothetical protein
VDAVSACRQPFQFGEEGIRTGAKISRCIQRRTHASLIGIGAVDPQARSDWAPGFEMAFYRICQRPIANATAALTAQGVPAAVAPMSKLSGRWILVERPPR